MSKTVLKEGDEGVVLIVKNVKAKPEKQPALRSPVHVVYGGAHLYKAETPGKLGRIALASIASHAPNFVEFGVAMRLSGSETLPHYPEAVTRLEKQLEKNPESLKSENYPAWFAWTVYKRTLKKLTTEPVEDFRIDFEDGYGFRPDEEEDSDAVSSARQIAKALAAGTITVFSGIRIKPLARESYGRSVRTLQTFIGTLLEASSGKLPDNFVVTLAKVADKKEAKELDKLLTQIEKKAGLKKGSIGIEIMVETPLSLIDKKGTVALPGIVKACGGRCTSAHFGAFDYTSALGISASYQNIGHDACNFARQIMLASLSPLGMRLSDSVTTELPVPVHKSGKLSKIKTEENKRAIHTGWRVHFDNVTRSMANGFYQSWDLHPNQLPARYAAVIAFFLEGLESQALRLKSFVAASAQANLTGNAFDDAATAKGIVNFFSQAVQCGALTESEVTETTGMNTAEMLNRV